MASVRVKIKGQGLAERVARPLSKIGVKHVRSGTAFVKTLEIALELSGNDYTSIIVMESDPYDVATLDIFELCDGAWNLIFEGEFNWFDVGVNRDKKKLSINPRERNPKRCIEGKWELDSSKLYLGSVQVVKPFNGLYDIKCCTAITNDIAQPPLDACLPAGTWWMKSDEFFEIDPPPTPKYEHNTCWHRIKATIPCVAGVAVPPIGDGWVLLEDNCPTNSIWVREPINENLIGSLKNGRFLNTSLNLMFEELDCDLTLRSNFLNINPSGSSPLNQAYLFSDEYLQDLTIHQKSDVKRPLDTNPASVVAWVSNLKDTILDLMELLNMDLRIIGNDARFEHVSFFEPTTSVNHTSISKKNEYTQDNDRSEQYEQYRCMDDMSSDEFRAIPIAYNTGQGVANIKLRKFSTDVVFIQETAASDQAVADAGFVICSTILISGVRSLIDYNRPLSWPVLHENLFRWNRRFPAGNLNGLPTIFYTWKLRRKFPAYNVPFCCGSAWDFYSTIQNGSELGEINEAVYYPEIGTAKITVNY